MSRKRKISLISLVIILFFVTVGSAYFAVAGSYLKKTIDKGYVPIKNDYTEAQNKDSQSFLVMGLDNTIERKLGTTRTDAMMVITVNNKTKKITYLSLPREVCHGIVLFKLMQKITKGCNELKPPIPTMDQQLLLTQLRNY